MILPYKCKVNYLQEGVEPSDMDKWAKNFGFPVCTATLTDEVGLDVANHILRDLGPAFGERNKGGDPALINEIVSSGFLGK